MDTKPIGKPLKSKHGATKHGISIWIREGRISQSVRGSKRLRRYLADLEHGLIEMQGGQDKITPAREILIKTTIEAYGVLLLASIFCREHGVVRPDRLSEGVVELQPVMGHQFLAFMNTCRQNLVTLGMDTHKADEILDLGRYIEAKDNERSGPAVKAPESGKAQGAGGEIVDPVASLSEIPGKDDAGDDSGGDS